MEHIYTKNLYWADNSKYFRVDFCYIQFWKCVFTSLTVTQPNRARNERFAIMKHVQPQTTIIAYNAKRSVRSILGVPSHICSHPFNIIIQHNDTLSKYGKKKLSIQVGPRDVYPTIYVSYTWKLFSVKKIEGLSTIFSLQTVKLCFVIKCVEL